MINGCVSVDGLSKFRVDSPGLLFHGVDLWGVTIEPVRDNLTLRVKRLCKERNVTVTLIHLFPGKPRLREKAQI